MIQNRMMRFIRNVVLFFICSPGILPALLEVRGFQKAIPISFAAVVASTAVFALILHLGASGGPREAFQLRDSVGDNRSKARQADKAANPTRSCAIDYDCSFNETRTFCVSGICKA